MSRPRMVVVAGPPGSGKSMHFPVDALGFDSFNVDVHAASYHGGSFRAIPPIFRARAQKACEVFVEDHIAKRMSFAVETTLRTKISIEQAGRARSAGFETMMIFITAGRVEECIQRVRLRGLAGGHSAPAHELRDIYERSMKNLLEAPEVFQGIELYDNSVRDAAPRRVGRMLEGRFYSDSKELPDWLPREFR